MDGNKRRKIAARSPWLLAAAAGLAAGAPAAAQQPAALQAQAPQALTNLNNALDALARSPSDASALVRAGWASLDLNDTQAALGFFRRAEQATPANGEAKAGEATAMLRLDDPATAVRLFDAAQATGTPMYNYAGDRGLALDMVGQNVNAQKYYHQALQYKYDPEVVRRLALSQAISGDEAGAEATLLPLLQRQDLSAYRTRAFALAIVGKGEEAVQIAEKMMPADMSSRMAPYLRYMPRLTRAQQAAAANLGEFPPASQIGRDTPVIAALAALNPPQVASLDSRLAPAGQPLGRSSRDQKRDKSSRKNSDKSRKGDVSVTYAPLPQVKTAQASAAPPAVAPRPAVQQPILPPPPRVAVQQYTPPQVPVRTQPAPTPAPTPTPTPASTPTAAMQQLAAQQAPPPPPQAQEPAPPPPQEPAPLPPSDQQASSKPVLVASIDHPPPADTDNSDRSDAPVPRPELSISPPPPPPAAKPVSLADAFADFSTKDTLTGRSAPDAVDITKIKPTREPKPEPKPAAKPKPPANPSRVWVQIGTGRDVKALGFTWRHLQKQGGALLAKHDGYSAKWGQTRRLLTGPYKSEDEADSAVKALKKKGFDAFEFTSDDGEEVTPLK